MSQVRGTISVDVAFTDSTTVGGAQSLKAITLRDATEYTTGKVAVASGTCGTTAVSINGLAPGYKDASGNAVTFSAVTRIALHTVGSTVRMDRGSDQAVIGYSRNDALTVGEFGPVAGFQSFRVLTTAGTASYTLVLYGT